MRSSSHVAIDLKDTLGADPTAAERGKDSRKSANSVEEIGRLSSDVAVEIDDVPVLL